MTDYGFACHVTFTGSRNDYLALGKLINRCQNGQRKRRVRRFENSITPNM